MNWKTIFKSLKSWEMQKRLLVILLIITIYRFLAHVPVPLAEPAQLKDVVSSFLESTDFGGFLNLLSGGAMSELSIVLVGLSPFITASIITQLLTKVIPKVEELNNDGETGRKKINQWTRMISVPFAILQSIAFIYILRQTVVAGNTTVLQDASLDEWIMAVTAMTAGSVLLMWLGEVMTEQGLGSGISLLIFASIISQLPTTLATLFTSLFDTSAGVLNVFGWFTLPVNPTLFWVTLALGSVALLTLYVLVKINEAQRIVTINYAKRTQGNSKYSRVKSVLPIKLIAAGVIPVIFAVAFLSLPAFVGQTLKATGNEAWLGIAQNLIDWFQAPDPGSFTGMTATAFIYPTIYFFLVIGFTYFYTDIVFNANQIAENLQKNGGFIEGVRPGDATESFLKKVVNRLNLFGATVLGLIAVMPFAIEYLLFNLAGISGVNLAVGGTGLLIVVTVGLESLRQINSRALMVTYDEYE